MGYFVGVGKGLYIPGFMPDKVVSEVLYLLTLQPHIV